MSADDYEKQFMAGDEAVYRERHVARTFVGLMSIAAVLAFSSGVYTLVSHAPAVASLAPFLAAFAVTFAAIFFSVMRTTVTRTELHVDYGMMGVHIPLSAITGVTIEEKRGTGAKYGPRGWSYAPMSTTRGVRVDWLDESGKPKSCYVGASDADALQTLLRASAQKTPAERRARIAAEAHRGHDAEIDVDSDAEGGAAAAKKARL